MLLVPGLIIALIGAHLYLVVKLGTTAPPWLEPKRTQGDGQGGAGLNRAEKEAYLRDYELLKKEGKPFFPYAVMKDSTMALIVVLVIVVMALVLGAEQGPKADPTTTTYTPRPEWYFFFLFEVLRVIKPHELVPLATIGVPTIGMVVLLLLPFFDRGPERRPERRPIAMAVLVLTVVVDGLPHLRGRDRRAADEDRHEGGAAIRGGQGAGRPDRAASPATRSATTATGPWARS